MSAKLVLLLFVAAGCLVLNGCTSCYSKPSPDQVKENTAQATAALKSDAKAVVGGVIEGLRRPTPDKPIDLNTGSKGSLQSLPGISDVEADRIVAARPYTSTRQLVDRRILSRDAYDKIADRITVNK